MLPAMMIHGDNVWGRARVDTLLYGEATHHAQFDGVDCDWVEEGPTALDLRSRAVNDGDIEAVLDPVQLDLAARDIRDPHVRAALQLRAHTSATVEEIESFVSDPRGRSGERLIERGADLVVRGEKARSRNRARAQAVCWRCCSEPVSRPGEECGMDCSALPGASRSGPRPELRHVGLQWLIDTQDDGSVPGQRAWARNEVSVDDVALQGIVEGSAGSRAHKMGHGPDTFD